MNVERVVGTNEGNYPLEVGVLAAFFDGILEGELGFRLPFFDVGFLPPKRGAGHGEEGMERGGVYGGRGERDEIDRMRSMSGR